MKRNYGFILLMLNLQAVDCFSDEIQVISGSVKEFNSEQKPLFDDGIYFELSCANNECVLKKISISSKKALIDSYDRGQVQGYRARIKSWDTAIAYLKGIDSLKEGKVKTWYARSHLPNSNLLVTHDVINETQTDLEININNQALKISAIRAKIGAVKVAGEECASSVRLWKFKYQEFDRVLSSVCPENILDGEYSLGTIKSYINWIGDIDNDSKPDLLISPEAGIGGEWSGVMMLYLSTQLEKSKKWIPASEFIYYDPASSGC